MASRALSAPLEFRSQRYREELRDVLILHGLQCGKAEDLAVATARLKTESELRKHLGAVVRSIVEREGGNLPRTDLVELIAGAIAGPGLSPEMEPSIRSLLAFLYQALPKPWEERTEQRLHAGSSPDFVNAETLAAGAHAEVAASSDEPVAARGSRRLHLVFSRLPLPGLDSPTEPVQAAEHEVASAAKIEPEPSPAPAAARQPASIEQTEPTPVTAASPTLPVPPPVPPRDAVWHGAYLGLRARALGGWAAYLAWEAKFLRASNEQFLHTGHAGVLCAAQARDFVDRLAAFRLPQFREQLTHMAAGFMAGDDPLPAADDPQGMEERRTWVAVGLAFVVALLAIALTLASAPQIDGAPTTAASGLHAAPPARVADSRPAMAPAAAVTSNAPATLPAKPSAYGKELGPPAHSSHVGSDYAGDEIIAPPHTTNAPGFGAPARPTQPAAAAELHEVAHAAPATAAIPVAASGGWRNPDARIAGDDGPAADRRPGGPRISAAAMARNVLSAPEPGYPLMARVAHLEGQVVLAAQITRDGVVADATALSGHHLLRHAAENAVRQWRYRPYVVNGQPVPVSTTIVVRFR